MKYFHSFSFSRVFLYILLFPVLVLTSCIKENNDNCPTGVFLRFDYTYNIQNEDLFDEQVNELILNIYDKDSGVLIQTEKISSTSLDDKNKLFVPLSEGNYHIIVWGGNKPLEDSYSLNAVNNIDNFYLDIKDDNKSDLGSLFFGSITYEQKDKVVKHESVSLIKNSNRIHVIIKGIGILNTPLVAIEGNNYSYNSFNEIIGRKTFSYIPEYSQLTDGSWQADFTVLRLLIEHDLDLEIECGDKFRENFSLIDEVIMQHPAIKTNDDLDRQDEYTLVFKVNEASNIIELISINDWIVTDDGGGI